MFTSNYMLMNSLNPALLPSISSAKSPWANPSPLLSLMLDRLHSLNLIPTPFLANHLISSLTWTLPPQPLPNLHLGQVPGLKLNTQPDHTPTLPLHLRTPISLHQQEQPTQTPPTLILMTW